MVALDLKNVDTDTTHDQMIAVIRYQKPYTIAGKGSFIISFALGNDVSLRSVLALPILLAMGADINLAKGLLSCFELKRSFLLELQPPGKGLPEGVFLNHYSPTVPTTVSTNLTHTNSLLHYTSADGIPQHKSLRTPYTVTRKFSYVPSNSSAVFT